MELTFNDGKTKILDFTKAIDMKRKIFAPLCDIKVFKNFNLDGWTLMWFNGKIDIAPERLYDAACLSKA